MADCTPADYQPPVFDYDNPSSGSSSVVGGYVYRGSEFTTFRGYYIAADVYSGTIYLLWPNGSGGFDSSEQTGLQNFVVGFGEAENGTLYAASQATGIVYKVVAAGGTPLPVTLEKFSVQAFEGFNQLQWVTSFEQNTARFGIEYSNSNQLFQRIGTVAAKRSSNGGDYAYRHLINTNEVGFYRLAIEDDNGETSFSFIVKVVPNGNTIKIYPTVIKNSLLTIELPGPSKKLQVVNSTGSILFETNIASGTTNIVLPKLAKGLYVVRIIGNEVLKTQRIVIQ